jgi:hypothetical protein
MAVANAPYLDGEIACEEVQGTLTEDQKSRIQAAIETIIYHDLRSHPHRFYLVAQFVETSLAKSSPGGMRGHRYLDLAGTTDGEFNPQSSLTTREVAEMLRGKVFA